MAPDCSAGRDLQASSGYFSGVFLGLFGARFQSVFSVRLFVLFFVFPVNISILEIPIVICSGNI